MAAITPEGDWTYGVALPIQTLTATLADPWEHAATVDDLVTIARKAESTGHAFVGVCDHVAIPDNDYASHMGTTWYDTVATLSYLAACTDTVNLCSAVWIAAYRHPLQTAKSFATLDHLSGGRAVLGVGAGHVEAEFEALGLSFADRGRMTDEAIDAVRVAVGADGGFCEFSGEFYEFKDMGVGPAAAQDANGFYLSTNFGLTSAFGADVTALGANHPTRCDRLLYANPASAPNARFARALADSTLESLISAERN